MWICVDYYYIKCFVVYFYDQSITIHVIFNFSILQGRY